MNFIEETIKATILYNLGRKKFIGGVHMPFDALKQGFPPHLGRVINKIAKELIKEGYLGTRHDSDGVQVSLNKGRLREIEEFIFKELGIQM